MTTVVSEKHLILLGLTDVRFHDMPNGSVIQHGIVHYKISSQKSERPLLYINVQINTTIERNLRIDQSRPASEGRSPDRCRCQLMKGLNRMIGLDGPSLVENKPLHLTRTGKSSELA
mgnify:CR=1 FL=1